MIYRYDYNLGWFTPFHDRLTMSHIWNEMQDDWYDDRIIYVGY